MTTAKWTECPSHIGNPPRKPDGRTHYFSCADCCRLTFGDEDVLGTALDRRTGRVRGARRRR